MITIVSGFPTYLQHPKSETHHATYFPDMMTKCNKPCGYTSAHLDPFIGIFCLIIEGYKTGFNNLRAEIREVALEGYFDVNCPECLGLGRWRRKSVRRERERERRWRQREGDVFEGEEELSLDRRGRLDVYIVAMCLVWSPDYLPFPFETPLYMF
ncbi:hypothetical protein ONZ45_g9850 [Pleurotus djamor]|nr:hypothetical protein ONZ45_g9850 [Pleurotus djamor]